MQKTNLILAVIFIILILVVLGALREIESKIDSIELKVTDQGVKINKLYDLVDAEPNQETQVKARSENKDRILAGKPFPELKFKDLNENTVDVSKLKGKVVIIDFWATWCGPCTAETTNLLSVYDEFRDKGFEIIGISLDKDLQKLTSYLEEHEIQWPNYYDGKGWQNEISLRFGVNSIPNIVLLDSEGFVKESKLRGERIREAVAGLFGEDIKKQVNSSIDPKDWKEEYVVELNTVDNITSSKFGVNWFSPHKLNISTEKTDFITSLPSFKYDMQRYLTLRLGDAENNQITAVVDFRKPDRNYFPFDLYLDRDRDGDLAEDFIENNKHFTGVQVPYSDGTTESYSLNLYSYSNDDSLHFSYQSHAGRYGFFNVGQTKVQFLVIDNNVNGIFNDREDVILMDWDLDGKIDGSHQADEDVPLYSLLKLPGVTYQVVKFDPPGRSMILKQISIDNITLGDDLEEPVKHQTSANKLLSMIETKPALPAILDIGERLTIKFHYDLGPAEPAHIWARPYTNGRLTEGYGAHPSPVYRKEEQQTGEAEGWFRFSAPAVVDEVRINMIDVESKKNICTLSEKIDAKWVEKE